MDAIRGPRQPTPVSASSMVHSIAIVGEAWGQDEARQKKPFVGASGQELTRMLREAGISRSGCLLTNVFNLHPPGNDIDYFCGGKADGIEGYPSLGKSRYVHSDYGVELDRLGRELQEVSPNVIIALGNTAMWALLGKTAISKYRGVVDVSTHLVPGVKVLPTYHPAAVIRDWSLRPTTVLDFAKAARESAYPELRRPHREVWIEPTLEDMERFYEQHLLSAKEISIDIETSGTLITCIGFSSGPRLALVVPFYDSRRKDRSYWHTDADECKAWVFVRRVLELPNPKLFQNGLYDIAFIWRSVGFRVRNPRHDTMLLHHALQPEALKGLGYLGSVYTDEGAWKQMRGSTKTIKRDE